MSEVEGVAEVMTGAAAARIVEPAAGEGPAGGRHEEGACLNCGSPLAGPHCHQCGQSAHVHRTISAWWHDLAHGVLHLDGKIWRTLPLLALWPGELTRRYIDGERAKFVSPLAVFLFATFLMFAVFGLMKVPLLGVGDGKDMPAAEMAAEAAQLERKITALEARRAAAAAVPARAGEATELARQVEAHRRERDAIAATGRYLDGEEVDGFDFTVGWERLDKGIQKARKNPALLLYKIQANAYKFSWALIPLSLPFLWMLFLHRRRYRAELKAYDHVVFITYSIAFMSLGLIGLVLLTAAGVSGGLVGLLALLVPPVHIFRQLRGAYGLRKRSALWRTIAVLFCTQLTIGLFFLLLLALGVLG